MDLYKSPGVISYIDRSFRDIADQDYIAARMHYRYELGHQFFWSALQALEKYFKGILLYNCVSAKALGHDIIKAYRRVCSITDIPFDFPSGIEDFLRHLNEQGPNRYFEYPAAATGRELLYLDRTVWFVRRYCQYLRGELPSKRGTIDRFAFEIAQIRAQSEDQAHKVHIWDGYLERVLDRGPTELRAHLVWKNPYFGRRPKRVLKKYILRSWSANPSTFLYPNVYRELRDLVDFSKDVRDHLEQQMVQKTSPGP